MSSGYTGTCDAETHEVTVCEGEPVELPLPEGFEDPDELEGLPTDAVVRNGVLEATFSRKSTFAFGGPSENRQLWNVKTTSDCPKLSETPNSPVCVGENTTRQLKASGGSGALRFELAEATENFELTPAGELSGNSASPGTYDLRIALEDENGVRTVQTLNVEFSDQCPAFPDSTLPASCAGFGYEHQLAISGEAPVEVLDYTAIRRDGNVLGSAEANELEELLHLGVRKDADGYVLTATPPPEALGNYVLGFTLKNTLSIERKDLEFPVARCATVPHSFRACSGAEFDFDLEGDDEYLWGFYEDQDPLRNRVSFFGTRLVGKLDTGTYEIAAKFSTPDNPSRKLTTFTLQVLPPEDGNCLAPDASAATSSSEDTAVTSTEETSSATPDAGALPPPLPHLAGCLGETVSYSTAEQMPNGEVWSLSGAPTGLQIDVDTGRIYGTPEAAGSGAFTVYASSSNGQQSQQYTYLVSESCVYSFISVNSSGLRNLYLGHVLQDPPAPVEVLAAVQLGVSEVDHFEFDSNGTALAFSTTDPAIPETNAYVATLSGRNSTGEVTFGLSPLPGFPLATEVLEMAWSRDGQLALLLEGTDANDPASNRRLLTFTLTSQTWAAVIDTIIPHGQSLVWMGAYPCLVGTRAQNGANFSHTFCLTQGGQTYETQGPPPEFVDDTQVRASSATLLAVTPFPGEQDYFNYVGAFRAEAGGWRDVTYQSIFASPGGDFIAVPQAGDNSLEIALAGDLTAFGPQLGDYTPIGSIPNCESVSAWSPSGALVCTPADKQQLTFATVSGSSLGMTASIVVSEHSHAWQKAIVDDRYFAFDSQFGVLTIVDMAGTPQATNVQVGTGGPASMALVALPEEAGHSRVAAGVGGRLFVVDLSAGAVVADVSPAAVELAHFIECTPSFQFSGFRGWCGGDETPRTFQVSHDGRYFLYLDDAGKLHLANVAGDVIVRSAQCGSALDCSSNFAFAL